MRATRASTCWPCASNRALADEGRLAVRLAFPVRAISGERPTGRSRTSSRTSVASRRPDGCEWLRTLDASAYSLGRLGRARARFDDGEAIMASSFDRAGRTARVRRGVFARAGAGAAGRSASSTPAREHWQVSGPPAARSTCPEARDPRARELERRIVLSQYLTAIQCAGSLPPQETGLHVQQLVRQVPPRDALVARRALRAVEPAAAAGAQPRLLRRASCRGARDGGQTQGYAGARWPKMTGPDGRESPSTDRAVPDLAAAAPDLLRRARVPARSRDRATLERYRDVVFETAEFMASYALLDAEAAALRARPAAHSGAGDHPAARDDGQSDVRARRTGASGSKTAQRWRERLGLAARTPNGTACSRSSRRSRRATGCTSSPRSAPADYDERRAGGAITRQCSGALRHAARRRRGHGDDAAHASLEVMGALEFCRHLGLGLSADRDDGRALSANRRPRSTRC